jgi:hypothetical protein
MEINLSADNLKYVVFLVVLYLARTTFVQSRTISYLQELLRREQEKSIRRSNELVSNLTETFSRGPAPTLDDLVQSTEAEFSLKPSKKP